MSTRKRINKNKFSFEECWERIKVNSSVSSFVQLSEIIKTSASNVTKRKEEDNFPPGWAYYVSKETGLLTEWILTGKGPKSLNELSKKNENSIFLTDLEKWAQEMTGNENIEWLEKQILELFPAFKIWREKKEGPEIQTSKKVA